MTARLQHAVQLGEKLLCSLKYVVAGIEGAMGAANHPSSETTLSKEKPKSTAEAQDIRSGTAMGREPAVIGNTSGSEMFGKMSLRYSIRD